MLYEGVYELVQARWGDYEVSAMHGSNSSKRTSSQEDAW